MHEMLAMVVINEFFPLSILQLQLGLNIWISSDSIVTFHAQNENDISCKFHPYPANIFSIANIVSL